MCGSAIGKVVGKLFGGSQKSSTTVVQQPLSALDLVQSTESKEPESPDLGGANKRNKRQKKSLTIERTSSGGNSGGLNL